MALEHPPADGRVHPERPRRARVQGLGRTGTPPHRPAEQVRGSVLPQYPLAIRFTELAEHLFTPNSVEEVLARIVTSAVELIDGADLASVSVLVAGGGIRTPAYTDPLALHLDEVQYETREGPSVQTAFAAGHPPYCQVADLAAHPGWPTFRPLAAGLGIRAILSLAVFTSPAGGDPGQCPGRRTLGALNLYARRPDAFGPDAREVGLLLAAYAAVALAATAQASQLREALHSRDVIGQAKGILMERRKLTADQAFDLLRRTSQRLNMKLRDVAARIADTRVEPPAH